GVGATILGLLPLWALRWLDARIPRQQRARLVVLCDPRRAGSSSLADLIAPLGYGARFRRRNWRGSSADVELSFEVQWRHADIDSKPWDLLHAVEHEYQVI